MTKNELSALLHEACETVSDSETDMYNTGVYPRIVYWSYRWENVNASGDSYGDVRTYQVSIWGNTPPELNPAVTNTWRLLKEAGLHPTFNHEYSKDDHAWHTFFALEVTE